MSDATAFGASIAAGIIANIVTFAGLRRFDKPTAIRIEREVIIIGARRVESPVSSDQSMAHITIERWTFSVQDRTRIHFAVALAAGLVLFGVLLATLLLV